MAKAKKQSFDAIVREAMATVESLIWSEKQRANDLEMQLAQSEVRLAMTPIPQPSGEPITRDALLAAGFRDGERGTYRINNRRLFLLVEENGNWHASFDSTYGGSVSSYRRLENMGEVLQLAALMGISIERA